MTRAAGLDHTIPRRQDNGELALRLPRLTDKEENTEHRHHQKDSCRDEGSDKPFGEEPTSFIILFEYQLDGEKQQPLRFFRLRRRHLRPSAVVALAIRRRLTFWRVDHRCSTSCGAAPLSASARPFSWTSGPSSSPDFPGESLPNWAPVGRWFFSTSPAAPCFTRASAQRSPTTRSWPSAGICHYLVGILYGIILVLIMGHGWLARPTFLPAWIFAIITIAAGWFLLQPGLGIGWAASKTPNPTKVRGARPCRAHLLWYRALRHSAHP